MSLRAWNADVTIISRCWIISSAMFSLEVRKRSTGKGEFMEIFDSTVGHKSMGHKSNSPVFGTCSRMRLNLIRRLRVGVEMPL
jgi:hypothetical protein